MSIFTFGKKSSAPPSARVSRDAGECSAWQSKICEIQREKVTPEIMASIRAKADRSAMASKAIKKASKIQRFNVVNQCSSAIAYRSEVESLSRRGGGGGASRSRESAKEEIAKMAHRGKAIESAMRSKALQADRDSDHDSDEEDDALEVQLVALEAECGVTSELGEVLTTHESASTEFEELLKQFVTEPTDPEELTTKFTLFENFLDTVAAIRTTTVAFWDTNKHQFEGGSLAAAEQEIRDLDSHENMGIIDDPRKWFVHTMTKKAKNNSVTINNCMSLLNARLALLSQELGECPFCLEAMTPDNVTNLGCCHRTCSECWDNWATLKGNRAFCPLCRHTEFVEDIMSGAL